ncbi:MAG: ATP-binding cassette domain-containing protein [Cytophagales bacterium]|nr:ATP-binding cassette domain-containing protein [Cytophagales bacterium]MDW8383867.1 ATP-binding cassette domain-containing protein [Flammeovirgaceae bacterium]
MNSLQFIPIIKRIAEIINHDYQIINLKDDYKNNINYGKNAEQFFDGISDKGQRVEIGFIRNKTQKENFFDIIDGAEYPILTFIEEGSMLFPILFRYVEGKEIEAYLYRGTDEEHISDATNYVDKIYITSDGNMIYAAPISLKPMVSAYDTIFKRINNTPVSRLLGLLSAEKKDILLIYFYAIINAAISLSLPLGIQSIVELISGGVIFNSIVLLISVVIVGVILGGMMSVLQYTIVEIIERRVFVKAAFEFCNRIPRVKSEAILKEYAPELMNRFFDVLTLQKGMPKLLIDLTGSIIQILFGLALLSFYHPLFIVFSFMLLATLTTIFWLTGPQGLRTNLVESKYKYKVAHWLEELARALYSFKLAGHTSLPAQKMHYFLTNYLYYRKRTFKILMTQFISVIGFKTVVTGGLLIIGSILVIDRQITLGQFVASEIIIILTITAVEKLILSVSTVYDMLTAAEKIGTVTDIPLEKSGGISLPHIKHTGMNVVIRDLYYKYPNSDKYVLKGINLDIKSGERICIAGYGGSGKNTFARILAGLLDEYQGSIMLNGISMRDINVNSLRDNVAKNVSIDDVIDGTLLENVTMGKTRVTFQDVSWALESVGLMDYISKLPDGLLTEMTAGGKNFSSSIAARLILARCIVERPQMLILNDILHDLEREEKNKLLDFLLDKKNPWTLICLSNDSYLFKRCDRIILFKDGQVVAQGTYDQLHNHPEFGTIV